MKPIIIIAIAFVLFIPLSIFAEETTPYTDYGFSLEYPSEWEVVDSWNNNPQKVFFKADHVGTSGISVVLTDKYELADLHDRKFIKIQNIDQSLLDLLENSIQTACKINRYGPCWDFELLDSKIIVIDGKKSVSIKYLQTMDDKHMTFRMILLPEGDNFWFIVSQSITDKIDFELFEKTVQSFNLQSISKSVEIPKEPKIVIQNIKIPFDKDIILEKTINVNLILIGETWSTDSKSSILNNLPTHRDPIFAQSQEKTGVRHTYDYNFISVSESEVNNLSKFMRENSLGMQIFGSNLLDIEFWQADWVIANHPEWVEWDNYGNVLGYNIGYGMIDALAMEEYLYENFVGSNPQLDTPYSVNLAFVAMDLEDLDYLHNYSILSKDDASGEYFTAMGLMGYGGTYDMLFFDLYAAPWFDIDIQTWEYVFPPWVETLHDCGTNQCLVDLISYHTSESLQYVISPDLLYPLKNADKYVVDAVIYTKPGGQNTVTPQTFEKFLDKDKVKKEFEFLYPHSEWDVNYSFERRDTHGLSYEFKKDLESASYFTFDNIYGEEKSIQLLSVEKIQSGLLSWAQEQTKFSIPNTVKIPVLIEIDSSNTSDVYLDMYGVLGIAPSMPDSDESCCAFGVTSQKKLWSEKIGITDLFTHEVGHTLGLMHPFMSTDNSGDLTINQYFNWYSSPMTYSFPNAGCGQLFNLVYSVPCGNASLSFTEFERNIINDVRLASLWDETKSNLENTIDANLQSTKQILQDSKIAFDNGDIYSQKGSLKLAIDGLALSTSLEKQVKKDVVNSKVPDWIKNNAVWWADGQIDDDSFVQGIQFLVKEKIITIPYSPETVLEKKTSVPEWVKNNAKWWADGMISEGDFLKGIEYLAKSGIIQVN